MVFRNLRERFGIDDQDYQVPGVFAKSEGSGSEVGPGSHRTRRGKAGPPFLCYIFLSCPAPAHPAVFPRCWQASGGVRALEVVLKLPRRLRLSPWEGEAREGEGCGSCFISV